MFVIIYHIIIINKIMDLKYFVFSPTTPGTELLRVTVTCSETDEKNATFKVVTKVRNWAKNNPN